MLVNFDKRELPMGTRIELVRNHMYALHYGDASVNAYADGPDSVCLWFDAADGSDFLSMLKIKTLLRWKVPFSVHQ